MARPKAPAVEVASGTLLVGGGVTVGTQLPVPLKVML